MQTTQEHLLNTNNFLHLKRPLMCTRCRYPMLCACLTETDGPGGPETHRHRPSSSPSSTGGGTGLILATDKDRARTFGFSQRCREAFSSAKYSLERREEEGGGGRRREETGGGGRRSAPLAVRLHVPSQLWKMSLPKCIWSNCPRPRSGFNPVCFLQIYKIIFKSTTAAEFACFIISFQTKLNTLSDRIQIYSWVSGFLSKIYNTRLLNTSDLLNIMVF